MVWLLFFLSIVCASLIGFVLGMILHPVRVRHPVYRKQPRRKPCEVERSWV